MEKLVSTPREKVQMEWALSAIGKGLNELSHLAATCPWLRWEIRRRAEVLAERLDHILTLCQRREA